VKRPEGFGQPTAPPSGSRSAPPSAPRPRAGEQRPAKEQRPSEHGQRPARAPRPSAPGKASGSRAREAEAELRAARRERKRAEKVELRRFTRRTRRRRLAWLTAGGLVVLLTGVLLVAVFSPLLALREIRIDGTSRLDPVTLQAAVDGQQGTPLALLDNDRITHELGDFPLIRSYTTEVLPPGTLAIHIVERQPIGVVQSGADFDLVDPAGIVVESSATRPDGFPLILLGTSEVGDKLFLSMTEVLAALPPDVLSRVDGIAATSKDDVTLALVGSNQRVVWGSSAQASTKATELAWLVAMYGGAGAGEYDVSSPRYVHFRAD
jgi:cell division protein FtsQ